MKRYERDCLRVITDAGFSVIEMRRNKHTVVKCAGVNGERRSFTLSSTPGCKKSEINFAADVKRAATKTSA